SPLVYLAFAFDCDMPAADCCSPWTSLFVQPPISGRSAFSSSKSTGLAVFFDICCSPCASCCRPCMACCQPGLVCAWPGAAAPAPAGCCGEDDAACFAAAGFVSVAF